MDNELRTFVLHEGLGRFHAGPTTDADRRFNELTFVLKKTNKTKIVVTYETIALERISIFFFQFLFQKKISKILFLCAAAAEKIDPPFWVPWLNWFNCLRAIMQAVCMSGVERATSFLRW